MSSIPSAVSPGGAPPSETAGLNAATQRRDMERFGLMLWMALSGSQSGLMPGTGIGAGAEFIPEDGTGARGGADRPGRDLSPDLPSARTTVSRTAAPDNLARGAEAARDSGGTDRGGRSTDRGGRAQSSPGAAESSSRSSGERGDGRTPAVQTTHSEGGRRLRAAGESARSVGAVRGTAGGADGGRGSLAAAYRSLAQGVKPGAPAAAPGGTAVISNLLKAQAAKLAGGARSSGTLTIPFRDALGAQGRIRLALRGGSLSATIISTNPGTVQRLGVGVGELRSALAEQGFAEAQITVREARPEEFVASRSNPRDEPGEEAEERAGRRRDDSDENSSGDPGSTRKPDEEVEAS